MIKKIALGIMVATALACGGGGGGESTGGGTGVNSGVVLNVNKANLAFGQTLNLTGSVPGSASQTLSWSATGGSITPLGASEALYTAPSAAGNYTITARSATETSKFATCIVTVSQVGIVIQPDAVTVGTGSKTTFKATVTGATNVAATFTATGGTLRSVNSTTTEWTAPSENGTYQITARASANSNVTATARATVANVGANGFVAGRVVREGTSSGIANVVIAFYNSSGSELARATTGSDGRFTGTVPATARRFHVIGSSVSAAYYKAYSYSSIRYTALIGTCTAPLPTVTAGQTVTLPANIELTSSSDAPPPPPNGCQ